MSNIESVSLCYVTLRTWRELSRIDRILTSDSKETAADPGAVTFLSFNSETVTGSKSMKISLFQIRSKLSNLRDQSYWLGIRSSCCDFKFGLLITWFGYLSNCLLERMSVQESSARAPERHNNSKSFLHDLTKW